MGDGCPSASGSSGLGPGNREPSQGEQNRLTGYTRLQVTRFLIVVFVAFLSNWIRDEDEDVRSGPPGVQGSCLALNPALSSAPYPQPLPYVLLTSRAAIFLPAEAKTRSSFMAAAQGTLCRLRVGPTPTGDQLIGRNSRTMVSISRGHSRTCGKQEEREEGRLRVKTRPS